MFLPSMRGIRMHPFSRVTRAEALARALASRLTPFLPLSTGGATERGIAVWE